VQWVTHERDLFTFSQQMHAPDMCHRLFFFLYGWCIESLVKILACCITVLVLWLGYFPFFHSILYTLDKLILWLMVLLVVLEEITERNVVFIQ
jgi:hypothetical protein